VRLKAPLFHTTHVTNSYDQAVDLYRRLFGRPVVHSGYWDLGKRSAIFVYVGDLWVEAAVPDGRPTGLQTFLDKFGSRFHSLGWYAEGVDELADELRARDIRFADDPHPKSAYSLFSGQEEVDRKVPRHGPIPLPPGYRHPYPDGWTSAVVFTHFRDTFGMHEFVQSSTPHVLPLREPDPDMLPEFDPLGVIESSHHTIVVPDCHSAAEFWKSLFDAEVLAEQTSAEFGTQSVFVRVGEGKGTVLEFAQPVGSGPARRDFDRLKLPILHAVWFRVGDLDVVRRHLAEEGFAIEVDAGDRLLLDPASVAGARYGFVARESGVPSSTAGAV